MSKDAQTAITDLLYNTVSTLHRWGATIRDVERLSGTKFMVTLDDSEIVEVHIRVKNSVKGHT